MKYLVAALYGIIIVLSMYAVYIGEQIGVGIMQRLFPQ